VPLLFSLLPQLISSSGDATSVMKIEYAARSLIFFRPSFPVGRLVKENPKTTMAGKHSPHKRRLAFTESHPQKRR
jgi:hypothetical protein